MEMFGIPGLLWPEWRDDAHPLGSSDGEPLAARLTSTNIVGFYNQVIMPDDMRPHTARRTETLTAILDSSPRGEGVDLRCMLDYLRVILRVLTGLKSVTIEATDQNKNIPRELARDFFQNCAFKLEKFHCSVDSLLVQFSNAFPDLQGVRDFKGVLAEGPRDKPPEKILAPLMPRLKYLETSGNFIHRFNFPCQVTHLSLHINRLDQPALRHASALFGHQLRSLRLDRTLNVCQSLGQELVDRAPFAGLFWQLDSPVLVCCVLKAPKLEYLELRDTMPSGRKWTTDVQTLRGSYWIPEHMGTPALKRIAWAPVWRKRALQLDSITRDYIEDVFTTIPVNFFAICTEESDLGTWRVSLRGPTPAEFETHWLDRAIGREAWRYDEKQRRGRAV